MEFLKGMFAGFTGIQFKKEPVLWMATIAAVLNIGVQIINGDVAFFPEGLETLVIAVGALVARGASTPIADPKLTDGTKLTPVGS